MPEPIRKLGRYELLRRIAEGGMGEIYLARQRGAGGFEKSLIIKTILPHLANSEEFIEKFLDEGRTVVQLVHGNIVPVFDMGEEDGEYFIAMEYIPGRDLRDIQKRLAKISKTMPVELAIYIVSEFCKGLDYAHRKVDEDGDSLEIVHRDVSPSNILISKEGEVKLIDFGIARATSRLGKTVTGRIQGKFCYMSPEQASGKFLDGRSDLFSTGVVLYELLTGHRPFEGESDLESLDLVRRCEFDLPSTFNHEVDEEIDAIVLKALSKDMQDRYENVDEFQGALLQCLYSQGRGPSSKDLGDFLRRIFPEGLEHNALRSARDSRPSILDGKKISLDDALEIQLDELGKAGIDPFHTTALQEIHASTASAGISATAPTNPEPKREVVSASSSRDSNSISYSEVIQPKGRKRFLLVGLLIGALLTILALIYFSSTNNAAKSTIESFPIGAEIAIDGATIPDAKTPFDTSLKVGKREITLSLKGYETRKFILDVSKKKDNKLSARVAVLASKVSKGPRTIAISVFPKDAKLFVDDSELGIGKGKILIQRDGLVKVKAKKEGCNSRIEMVGYADARSKIEMKLQCDSLERAKEEEVQNETKLKKFGEKSVRFRSEPSGAILFLQGKKVGKLPLRKKLPFSKMISVEVRKEGYKNIRFLKRRKTFKKTHNFRLNSIAMGCLNFSVGSPVVAKIAIDGKWLEGAPGRIRNYKLSVGKHLIRAKNKTAQKDQTFSVRIESGDTCTTKHVWPREKSK